MSLPKITLMQTDEVGRAFHRAGWIYEEKYDGLRVVAYTRCCSTLASRSCR